MSPVFSVVDPNNFFRNISQTDMVSKKFSYPCVFKIVLTKKKFPHPAFEFKLGSRFGYQDPYLSDFANED
jgi:hypothetical protein